MARSNHGTLTAADRYDRRKGRQGRPTQFVRRQGTRRAVVALALQEA